MTKDKNTIYCSFCNKRDNEVKKLIAGPVVFICDECVSLCVGVMQGSDANFFNQLRADLSEDKTLRRATMKTIDAPDNFWEFMDESDICERMAQSILRADVELSDHLYERAHNLMKKARTADRLGWKLIHDAHPDITAKQMQAAHGVRKIYVTE